MSADDPPPSTTSPSSTSSTLPDPRRARNDKQTQHQHQPQPQTMASSSYLPQTRGLGLGMVVDLASDEEEEEEEDLNSTLARARARAREGHSGSGRGGVGSLAVSSTGSGMMRSRTLSSSYQGPPVYIGTNRSTSTDPRLNAYSDSYPYSSTDAHISAEATGMNRTSFAYASANTTTIPTSLPPSHRNNIKVQGSPTMIDVSVLPSSSASTFASVPSSPASPSSALPPTSQSPYLWPSVPASTEMSTTTSTSTDWNMTSDGLEVLMSPTTSTMTMDRARGASNTSMGTNPSVGLEVNLTTNPNMNASTTSATNRFRPGHAYSPSSNSTSTIPLSTHGKGRHGRKWSTSSTSSQASTGHLSVGAGSGFQANVGSEGPWYGAGGHVGIGTVSIDPTNNRTGPLPRYQTGERTRERDRSRYGNRASGRNRSRSRSPHLGSKASHGSTGSTSPASSNSASSHGCEFISPLNLLKRILRRLKSSRQTACLLILVLIISSLLTVSFSPGSLSMSMSIPRSLTTFGMRNAPAKDRAAAAASILAFGEEGFKPSPEGSLNRGPLKGPRWVIGDWAWAGKSWKDLKTAAEKVSEGVVRGGLGGMGISRLGSEEIEIQKIVVVEEEDLSEGVNCQFVSPVEAYQSALRRLRIQARQKERVAKALAKKLQPQEDLEDDLGGDSEFESEFRKQMSDYEYESRRTEEDDDDDEEDSPFEERARNNLRRRKQDRSGKPKPHIKNHVYSPSGHLIVSDDYEESEHPIPQLLALGEKRWEEMLERQSTSLGEACVEYRKRYGRKPPKGFDIWWDFAMTHNLVLPDEYDRIHLDLAPFWALPRSEMRKRAKDVESIKETYTLVIKDGKVDVEISDESGLAWEGTRLRAADQASLVKSFARFLPDMRTVFSIHDHPQVYLSSARRSSLVELGLSGQHTKHLKESDNADVLWSRSCAPESNLRKNLDLQEQKSLVYDTLEASDICQNPYLMDLHGLTVEKHGPSSHPRPHTSLLPLFSLAKTSVNSDILITPLDQFNNGLGTDPKWEDKRDSRLVWRGSTTGISWMNKDTPWRKSHRSRLHFFAQNQSDEYIDYPVADFSASRGPLTVRRESQKVSDLSEFFYDMKLAGEPLQCNMTDGTCDDMKREIDFAPHQHPDAMNRYKFLFDIDGNGWSGRFRRLMSTNSVVLKAGIFTEWFQPHLIPWFMYVPTRLDYSDLPTIMSFFRGTPSAPNEGFDEVAKALAANGKCFVNRMFRVEDLQAYMFRLFLEYARLIAPEEEDVDFICYEEDYEDESGPNSDEFPAFD